MARRGSWNYLLSFCDAICPSYFDLLTSDWKLSHTCKQKHTRAHIHQRNVHRHCVQKELTPPRPGGPGGPGGPGIPGWPGIPSLPGGPAGPCKQEERRKKRGFKELGMTWGEEKAEPHGRLSYLSVQMDLICFHLQSAQVPPCSDQRICVMKVQFNTASSRSQLTNQWTESGHVTEGKNPRWLLRYQVVSGKCGCCSHMIPHKYVQYFHDHFS